MPAYTVPLDPSSGGCGFREKDTGCPVLCLGRFTHEKMARVAFSCIHKEPGSHWKTGSTCSSHTKRWLTTCWAETTNSEAERRTGTSPDHRSCGRLLRSRVLAIPPA
jgi:hypothetical protein